MSQVQSTGNTYNTLISSRNQTVVPSTVRSILKLKGGDSLIWRIIYIGNTPKVIAEPRPKSWAHYSRGLGKHIWEGVSIEDYVKNLRSEWDAP